MNRITMRGAGGRLLVGPYQAAQIGQWSLEGEAGSFCFTFSPVNVDPFWSMRSADCVEIQIADRAWVWRDVAVNVRAGSVTLPSAPTKR